MFGVMLFSYVLDQFIIIYYQYKLIIEDVDDSENLSRFLGTMKHFNKNKPLSQELKENIEGYFAYKWDNDRN